MGGKGGASAQGGSNAGGLNAGNTGGTGGSMMHMASPCSALPTAGTLGEDFPRHHRVVPLRCARPVRFGGGVVGQRLRFEQVDRLRCNLEAGQHRSQRTWTRQKQPLEHRDRSGEPGHHLLGGWLWCTIALEVDQRRRRLVESFPPGSEYVKVQEYDFVNNVSMDPTNHLHLATATHGTCAAPYAPNCDAETFDGGATWKLSVAPSSWPEGGGVYVLDAKTWLWCDPFGGIWRTADNAATFQKVHNGYGGNGEFTNKPLVPASDGAYYLSSIQGILRSADAGKTWTQVKKDGKWVGFAISSTTLYAADQWSNTFASAAISDPTKWTTFPPPAASQATKVLRTWPTTKITMCCTRRRGPVVSGVSSSHNGAGQGMGPSVPWRPP